MTPEAIEHFAIRAALGNNGGIWADHYTEAQKEHWRQFVKDISHEIIMDEYGDYGFGTTIKGQMSG
ncbi:MAG: hypothetical protein IPO08_21970 [Xanthomonadales bacterium]|nr:hypothetical protein [Xanthomonadales bacterium]